VVCVKNFGVLKKRTALRVHQFAQRESHLSTTMYDGTETDTVKWLTTHAGPRRGNWFTKYAAFRKGGIKKREHSKTYDIDY
jgi:hypothetical protein